MKLDEDNITSIKDSSINNLIASSSGDTNYFTPRGKILRKGHQGAMGFSINASSNSRIIIKENDSCWNMTKSSHTWYAWVCRTDSNGQERLWGDDGDGVNKRVFRLNYQFTNNSRSIDTGLSSIPLNEIAFIAIVYDTVNKTYKRFLNGVWASGSYIDPVPSVNGNTSIQIPATAGYGHYGCRGYFSDLTFFNKAIAESDIELLYQLGKL